MKNLINSKFRIVAVHLSVGMGLIPAVSEAATLKIDINGGNGPTLSGWTAFDPVGPTTYTNALGAGMDVSVTVSQDGGIGNLRDKDRGATITGDFASLSNMLRDYYGTRQINNVVTLTLTLPAGSYDFLSYHHDGENGSTNTQDVTVGIVGDANISGVTNASSSFTMMSGTAPTTASLRTYSTQFTLATAGDVSFTNLKTDGAGEHGFNGFVISTVPEPSAALLVAASMAMVGMRRRR